MTAATLAVVAGAITKELMARTGYSAPAMAICYQHVMEGRDAIIASALDRLIRTGDHTKPNARRWHGVCESVGLARRKAPLTRAGTLWFLGSHNMITTPLVEGPTIRLFGATQGDV